MDKDFILNYLKMEHLEKNPDMYEIAEILGFEVVKVLMKNHASLRNLYIPIMSLNKDLMYDVIKSNYLKMTIRELCNKTGLSRRKVIDMVKKIKEDPHDPTPID